MFQRLSKNEIDFFNNFLLELRLILNSTFFFNPPDVKFEEPAHTIESEFL